MHLRLVKNGKLRGKYVLYRYCIKKIHVEFGLLLAEEFEGTQCDKPSLERGSPAPLEPHHVVYTYSDPSDWVIYVYIKVINWSFSKIGHLE